MAVTKLTPDILRQMILEEKAKMKDVSTASKDMEVVDADGYADTLVKDIDYMKALQIKEAKIRKGLNKIIKERKKVKARIVKKLG